MVRTEPCDTIPRVCWANERKAEGIIRRWTVRMLGGERRKLGEAKKKWEWGGGKERQKKLLSVDIASSLLYFASGGDDVPNICLPDLDTSEGKNSVAAKMCSMQSMMGWRPVSAGTNSFKIIKVSSFVLG
jgi:hypothetical protein